MNNNQHILDTFMRMSQGGGNPQMIAQQMLASNPEIKQLMTQMQNMANGLSPKDFAIQYAKQNGVSEEQVMQVARKFGIN